MRFLRQSTASQEILLGPFVAASDGSAQTGLTIANTDIKLLKGGATSEGNKNSGGGTHIAGGRYSAVLDATDTDTVGILEVSCNPAAGIPWNKSYYVLEEAVYDMLFAASALGYIANAPVNVAQFGGTNGTFAGGRPEVNTTLIEGSDATNQIRDAVVDDATRIDASALNTLSSHDPGEAIMGATDLGTGSGLTSLATAAELAKVPKSDGTATWNATALAAIQQQAEDALVAHDAPTNTDLDARTLASADYATAAEQATADGKLDAIQGVTDQLADTLEDQGGGTYGFTEAALQEAPTGGGSGPSAADIADAVWEEALGDHSSTSGSTAEALAAAGGAGDPWITPLPGSYTSGQAGYILGTNLNATVSSRASQTSVDDLPTNSELATALGTADDAVLAAIAGLNDLDATDVQAAAAAALTAYDPPTNAEMEARTIAAASYATAAELAKVPKSDGTSSWNATALAAINAQADQALADYDGPTRAEATADKDEILAVVEPVKDQTDQLTFTEAGAVDSRVTWVAATEITAAGTGGQGYGAPP